MRNVICIVLFLLVLTSHARAAELPEDLTDALPDQAAEWMEEIPEDDFAGGVTGILEQMGNEAGDIVRQRVRGAAGVLVAVVLVVAVAARLLRKLFHFAGFGIADIVLGVALSVVKYLLVLSVLVAAFDRLNADYTLADRQTIGQSRSYGPLLRLSEMLPPLLEEVSDRLPRTDAAAATEAPGAEKTDENDG